MAASAGVGQNGSKCRGKCKWFNVVKGYGFITPADGSQEVFVHQSVIQMPGFRSLAEGEDVEYETRPSDKGLEATVVCGVAGTYCKGSERRPVAKKKSKKLRCYNCGDFGGHIASKCPQGPLPKRCHQCKSSDHLIADCPLRPEEKQRTTQSQQELDSPTQQQFSDKDAEVNASNANAEGEHEH